jgi:hydroxymethylpyrimidine/phosphomethylpyrimidine kinase
MSSSGKLGRVLIVAGSDSGGGAGIQADIKTVTALGGYAMTAVTAVTVQNTTGVTGIHHVPADIVRGQMRACLDDIGADAIKTGMLADSDVIEAVAAELEVRASGIPVVIDPVMIAKGGTRLVVNGAVDAIKRQLLPRAALITPNVPEAQSLLGTSIESVDGMLRAAERLLSFGAKAVLLKGGHMRDSTVTDVLVTNQGHETLTHPRIETQHTHGTGCTLASAIACGLAQGLDLLAAVKRARAFVWEAIRTAPGFGKGHGPLNHAHTVRPFGS